MTAHRDLDELASALLDGRLADDEAAAARRDPAVSARLAELSAVREAVGLPPEDADPAARERGLAAALAAYDAADEDAAQPAASRADTPWRPRGTARRRWLTAAAALLVVAGLGALVRNWDGSSDDGGNAAQEVATGDRSDEGGGSGTAAADAEGGTEESAVPSTGAGVIVDLGDVGSADALADRARSIVAGRLAGAPAEASGGDPEAQQGADDDTVLLPAACDDAAESELLSAAPDRVVLRGRATLEGEAVDVLVLGMEGEERVVAVDASCTVVVDQPLQN